jgi:hypothetical protein
MAKRPTPFAQPPGHPISYFPSLVPVAGSVKAAVLLCQLVYWTPRTRASDGWIYKSQLQLMQETGMTRHELQQSRTALKRRGLLADRFGHRDHRLWLRVDTEKYNAAIGLISEEESTGVRPETGRSTSGNRTNQIRKPDVVHPETGRRSNTEITTETTTETTTTTTAPKCVAEPKAPRDETVVEVVAPPVAIAQEDTDDAHDGRAETAAPLWRQFYTLYPTHLGGEEKTRAEWERQRLDALTLDVIRAKLPWQRRLSGRMALPDCPHIYLKHKRFLDSPTAALGPTPDGLRQWCADEPADADATPAAEVTPEAPSCCERECMNPVGVLSLVRCDQHMLGYLQRESEGMHRTLARSAASPELESLLTLVAGDYQGTASDLARAIAGQVVAAHRQGPLGIEDLFSLLVSAQRKAVAAQREGEVVS